MDPLPGDILDRFTTRAVSNVLEQNPFLKCWVNPEDLSRDLTRAMERVDLDDLDQQQLVILISILLRKLVIQYHRRMDDWTIYDNRMKLKPGAPRTPQGWLARHQAVEHLPEFERIVYQLVTYSGLTIAEVEAMVAIPRIDLEDSIVQVEEQIKVRDEPGSGPQAGCSLLHRFVRLASFF